MPSTTPKGPHPPRKRVDPFGKLRAGSLPQERWKARFCCPRAMKRGLCSARHDHSHSQQPHRVTCPVTLDSRLCGNDGRGRGSFSSQGWPATLSGRVRE